MVKVEAIMDFNYTKYDTIVNLISKDKVQKGKIFAGDIFEVTKEESKYLSGNNDNNIVAVKIIETEQVAKSKKETIKKATKTRAKSIVKED